MFIRVALVLVALLCLPATASAGIRSPAVGETTLLSPIAPPSRTEPPAIAGDGNTTFVAFQEQWGGIQFHRIAAAGTEMGGSRTLQEPGTAVVDGPKIAVSGDDVYVAWTQLTYFTLEAHAVLAASHDGGRTFTRTVAVGKPTGLGAWDLQLGVDGDNVFVSFVDARNRVWTVGSRDGGRTFPCSVIVTPPGDTLDNGSAYSFAVDGDRLFWTWRTRGFDVYARRSTDGGQTLEPAEKVYDSPNGALFPGTPVVRADGGLAAIAHSLQLPSVPRPDGSGSDAAWEPKVLVSTDGGASWNPHRVGDDGSRCVGICAAPYGLAVESGRVYVAWRGNNQIWLARSIGGGFGGPAPIGPYLYLYSTSPTPELAAHGDTVVATWHTAPAAGSADLDVFTAFSSDGGRTFAVRTIAAREKRDLFPVATAWGPDPQGAGFAYWTFEGTTYTGDTSVNFVPLSAAEPDVAVVDVRPAQATSDAARLAAGRPTTIRATLRSQAVVRATVPVRIDLTYDGKQRTVEQDVVLRPGTNTVQLLATEPVKPGAGTISAKVTVGESAADTDPSNNTGEGARPVVATRGLKILFVPVAADDEALPSCTDVREVAEGTAAYLKASWPVDPARVRAVASCSAKLVHPAGLTAAGLMESGMLMARIDRLKWAAGADKVIGVVPTGWFSRQLIDGFEHAVGISQHGGGYDAALIERQNTGGWAVAHELAHNYGWTETEGEHSFHLDNEPAPGFWTGEKRDIPASTLDFMHYNTAGASVTDPTGRWLSKQTWDYLTIQLAAGPVNGLAAEGDTLALAGAVKAGAATAGPAWELPGEPAETDGPLTFEQLDAGGTVLQTRSFAAVDDLGPIGNDQATGHEHIVTPAAGFSLRVPALAAARTLRVRRGADVLLTRTRSAAAPAVKVDTPAQVALGEDLKVTWTATDADGDALTSLVSISTDEGATWTPLGDATTASALTVKATLALGGEHVRVRVTTSDGWNTTSAESEPFAVGGTLTDGLVIALDNTHNTVHAVPIGGGEPVEVASKVPTLYSGPRWAPDGSRLVYSDGTNLWTVRGDGSERKPLTHLATGDHPPVSYTWPVWGPDDQIVVPKFENDIHVGSVLIDAVSGAEVRAFPKLRLGAACEFTRDGAYVLTYSSGNHGFARYRADGTGELAYPSAISGDDCLSVSPDGRYGVTSRTFYTPFAVTDLVVYDLQTGAMRNLTNGQFGTHNEMAKWSPTGDWIVWASNKDSGHAVGGDIWKIRPDGTGAAKLMNTVPGQREFRFPDIQPLRGLPADPEPTLEERLPQANAVAAQGAEGAPITLDASGSEPGADGAALTTYAWDLDGDGVYTDATGAKPNATFGDEGTYPVSVLVRDENGRSATATATVQVANAAPVITDARADEGGRFTAHVRDAGEDELTATLDGEAVPLIATGDGFLVTGHGSALVVEDGDGGHAEATAVRVSAPAKPAPTAQDATVTVVAGDAVDIALPAQGEALSYEIVDAPASGTVALRAAGSDPAAPDLTYVAGPDAGSDRFTYRVSDGDGTSRVATVTVEVQARSGPVVVPAEPAPAEPATPAPPRPARTGSKPVDAAKVERQTAAVEAAATFTLPSAKACVSRRSFRIRVKKGDYREVAVWVNNRRVKVLRGKRITAAVDLRGLPKGRFTVKIAATLTTGKVIKSTRAYRTCTPGKKKGARR